jgi:type II secretory pathway predicted ATPase ExeA
MDRPDPGPTVAALLHDSEPTLPFVTARSRQALDHLCSAFDEGRSLAILNSGWRAGSNHVIRGFLAGLGNDVSIARVTNARSSEIEGMRELIRSIGFDPKMLVVTELHQLFENFLSFEKKRHRRTIVVLEDAGINGEWVCEYAGRLVELEERGQYGMTVILMRQTKFDEYTDEPTLGPMSYKVGKHISLTPFTQAETRDFVRWRIRAAKSADIGRIFEFESINLIHELCDGMPDAIDHLCCAALVLADDEDVAPVTTDIVMRASKVLQLEPMTRQPTAASRLAATPAKSIPTLKLPEAPKLILTYKGKTVQEQTITQQRVTIGRGKENDLCIESPFISRQHATIFCNGAETAVVDLDSKNGTFVNSRRVQVQTIADQDQITIGHHSIRFLNPDAPRIKSLHGASRSGPALTKNIKSSRPVIAPAKVDVARK